MNDTGGFKFTPIPLDAHVLQTPFEIQTAWHIITGAPSCGKTTLIALLARQGFRIAPEGARIFMESEIARGRTIEDIRAHPVDLQVTIKNVQRDIERQLPADVSIFLDRGLPDCLAWYRAFGLDPNSCLQECFHFRYASVFVLDPLPLRQDGLRFWDTTLQTFLDAWHERDYSALGYRITRVPALPPEARRAYVLEAFAKQG